LSSGDDLAKTLNYLATFLKISRFFTWSLSLS
jgi:hypothetical protein